MWQSLWREERGQDVVEYTLLMAAIVLACGGVVIAVGRQTNVLWTIVNSRLAAANNTGS